MNPNNERIKLKKNYKKGPKKPKSIRLTCKIYNSCYESEIKKSKSK